MKAIKSEYSIFEREREEILEVLNEACYQYKELNANFRYETLERYTKTWHEFLDNLSNTSYYFDLFSTLLINKHPLFKKENSSYGEKGEEPLYRNFRSSYRNFIIFNNNIVFSQLKDNFYREIPRGIDKLKVPINNNHLILYRLGYKIVFASKYSRFLKENLYLFYLYLLLSFVFIYTPFSKEGVFVDFSADKDFFDKFYNDITKEGILGVKMGDLQDNNNTNNKGTDIKNLEENWEKFVMNIKPLYLYKFLQKHGRGPDSFEEKNISQIYDEIVTLFKSKRDDLSIYLELFLYPFILKLRKFWDFYKEIKLLYEYEEDTQIKSLKGIYTYATNTLNILNKSYEKGYFTYVRLFDAEISLINYFYGLLERKSVSIEDLKNIVTEKKPEQAKNENAQES